LTNNQARKSRKNEFSLFLDKKLVSDFDKKIFPFKRSNVIHKLISEYLSENTEGKTPQSKVPQMTNHKETK